MKIETLLTAAASLDGTEGLSDAERRVLDGVIAANSSADRTRMNTDQMQADLSAIGRRFNPAIAERIEGLDRVQATPPQVSAIRGAFIDAENQGQTDVPFVAWLTRGSPAGQHCFESLAMVTGRPASDFQGMSRAELTAELNGLPASLQECCRRLQEAAGITGASQDSKLGPNSRTQIGAAAESGGMTVAEFVRSTLFGDAAPADDAAARNGADTDVVVGGAADLAAAGAALEDTAELPAALSVEDAEAAALRAETQRVDAAIADLSGLVETVESERGAAVDSLNAFLERAGSLSATAREQGDAQSLQLDAQIRRGISQYEPMLEGIERTEPLEIARRAIASREDVDSALETLRGQLLQIRAVPFGLSSGLDETENALQAIATLQEAAQARADGIESAARALEMDETPDDMEGLVAHAFARAENMPGFAVQAYHALDAESPEAALDFYLRFVAEGGRHITQRRRIFVEQAGFEWSAEQLAQLWHLDDATIRNAIVQDLRLRLRNDGDTGPTNVGQLLRELDSVTQETIESWMRPEDSFENNNDLVPATRNDFNAMVEAAGRPGSRIER